MPIDYVLSTTWSMNLIERLIQLKPEEFRKVMQLRGKKSKSNRTDCLDHRQFVPQSISSHLLE